MSTRQSDHWKVVLLADFGALRRVVLIRAAHDSSSPSYAGRVESISLGAPIFRESYNSTVGEREGEREGPPITM